MATIPQIIANIRFQLEQLSARNAHHEFEHIARHIARARICSNILPATGPVASGGDQGRDFETFRSYMEAQDLDGSFVGVISNKPLAFACSLEKRIEAKIKRDVAAIVSSGEAVEGICYFCSADVPVARRHKLQAWTRKTHHVRLEIIDGQAISELLAQRDTFWIASEFLGIPAELYPLPPEEDEHHWYVDLLARWRGPMRDYLSYAHFEEVKAASRHAVTNDQFRSDVPFWIGILENFLADPGQELLSHRARYEIAYANLRGLETLRGAEELLRTYFETLGEGTATSDLHDASALSNYCFEANARDLIDADFDEVRGWRSNVVDEINRRLDLATLPGLRCDLLDVRGYMNFSGLYTGDVESPLESCMNDWNQVAELAPQAPLFPLDRFADHLTGWAPFLVRHPSYFELTQKVDELVAARTSAAQAAQKCWERAEKLREAGHQLLTIRQLHDAKVKWFSNETLRQSIRAITTLAMAYQDLGLSYAAKYYAMSAANLSVDERSENTQDIAWKALAQLAEDAVFK